MAGKNSWIFWDWRFFRSYSSIHHWSEVFLHRCQGSGNRIFQHEPASFFLHLRSKITPQGPVKTMLSFVHPLNVGPNVGRRTITSLESVRRVGSSLNLLCQPFRNFGERIVSHRVSSLCSQN